MFGSGGRCNKSRTVPEQLLAAHKEVHKGILIDDSVWPEENDIRRRFLSDQVAAFTLLYLFENRRARERSERTREPLALVVNKAPAVFIFISEIDDLQRENRSTPSKEKVEGLYANKKI